MQVKKDIIGILRKKQETINKNLEEIITGIEEKMNIENLPEIESWLYEFSVAVKFIEKKTMGFPSDYENSIILESILKEDLSNDELQRKVMPFILSYMQILRMVQTSSSISSNETSPSSISSPSSSSSSLSSSDKSE
tara:strand:- start:21 stop:431 length:411 start_codon:yes stop_codon:yes gene_type:complete